MLNKIKKVFRVIDNIIPFRRLGSECDQVGRSIEEARLRIREGEAQLRRQIEYVDSIKPTKEMETYFDEIGEWLKEIEKDIYEDEED